MSQKQPTAPLSEEPSRASQSADGPDGSTLLGQLVEGLIVHRTKERVSQLADLPIGTEPKDLSVILGEVDKRAPAMSAELSVLQERAWQTYRMMGASVAAPTARSREEERLEDFLAHGANLSLLEPGLQFVARQVVTASGIIDIAACSGAQKVTVELKARDYDVRDVITQLTKYLVDRKDDRLIFVAPKISATLYFNLKQYVDAGRLSFVKVDRKADDTYSFTPVQNDSFTPEAMEREITRAQRRGASNGTATVRVLKAVVSTGGARRSYSYHTTETSSAEPESTAATVSTTRAANEGDSVAERAQAATNERRSESPAHDALAGSTPESLLPKNPADIVKDSAIADLCLGPFQRGGRLLDRRAVLGATPSDLLDSPAWKQIEVGWGVPAQGLQIISLAQECLRAVKEHSTADYRDYLQHLGTLVLESARSLIDKESLSIRRREPTVDIDARLLTRLSPEELAYVVGVSAELGTLHTKLFKALKLAVEGKSVSSLNSDQLVSIANGLPGMVIFLGTLARVEQLLALHPKAAVLYLAGIERKMRALPLDSILAPEQLLAYWKEHLRNDEQIFEAILETLNSTSRVNEAASGDVDADRVREIKGKVSLRPELLAALQMQRYPPSLAEATIALNELTELTADMPDTLSLKALYRRSDAENSHRAGATEQFPRVFLDPEMLERVCPSTAAALICSFFSDRAAWLRAQSRYHLAALNADIERNVDLRTQSGAYADRISAGLSRYYLCAVLSAHAGTMASQVRVLSAVSPQLALKHFHTYEKHKQEKTRDSSSMIELRPAVAAERLDTYLRSGQQSFENCLAELGLAVGEGQSTDTPERPVEAINGAEWRARVGLLTETAGDSKQPDRDSAAVLKALDTAAEKARRLHDLVLKSVAELGEGAPKDSSSGELGRLAIELAKKGGKSKAPQPMHHTKQGTADIIKRIGVNGKLPSSGPIPLAFGDPELLVETLYALYRSQPGAVKKSPEVMIHNLEFIAGCARMTAKAALDGIALSEQFGRTLSSDGHDLQTIQIFAREAQTALLAERYFSYRAEALRTLLSASPQRAIAYLRFSPGSIEELCPHQTVSWRKQAKSSLAALQEGSPATASMLTAMLHADYKLFSQLCADIARENGEISFDEEVRATRLDHSAPEELATPTLEERARLFLEQGSYDERCQLLGPVPSWSYEYLFCDPAPISGRLVAEALLKRLERYGESLSDLRSSEIAAIGARELQLVSNIAQILLFDNPDADRTFFARLELATTQEASLLLDGYRQLAARCKRDLHRARELLALPSSRDADPPANEIAAVLYRVSLLATAAMRIRGITNCSVRAATVYAIGVRELLTEQAPDTAVLLRAGLREDTLLSSILEVLSHRRTGAIGPSQNPREVREEVCLSRALTAPIEPGQLQSLELVDPPDCRRAIAALCSQLRELPQCSNDELALQVTLLAKSFDKKADGLALPLLLGDCFPSLTNSPLVGAVFLRDQLRRQQQCYDYHARHLTSTRLAPLAERFSPGREPMSPSEREQVVENLSLTYRSMVLGRLTSVVREAGVALASIDGELACQFIVGSGLLEVWGEFDQYEQVVERTFQLKDRITSTLAQRFLAEESLVRREPAIQILSGRELCAQIGFASEPTADAIHLSNGRFKSKLTKVDEAYQAALSSVSAFGSPASYVAANKRNTRIRASNHDQVTSIILAHNVEGILERELVQIGVEVENSMSSAIRAATESVRRYKEQSDKLIAADKRTEEWLARQGISDVEQYLPLRLSAHASIGFTALQSVLTYRLLCAETLRLVDPAAAQGYLRFTISSVERLLPRSIQAPRECAPSTIQAILHGDRTLVDGLKAFLETDRKLFVALMERAEAGAIEMQQRDNGQVVGSLASTKSPFEKLSDAVLRAGDVTLKQGPVHDAAVRFLSVVRELAVEQAAVDQMTRALKGYKLAKTVGSSHGLSPFQAELFLLGLEQKVRQSEPLGEQEIRSLFEDSKFRLPPRK